MGHATEYLFDDQFAIHDHPVAWKRAQERIAAWLGGSLDGDRLTLPGTNDVSVAKDIIGLGNVLASERFGIGDQLVGQLAPMSSSSGSD